MGLVAVTTLVLSGAIHLVASLSFLAVAVRLRSHAREITERGALTAFSIWWGGLGAYMAVQSGLNFLVASGTVDAFPWFYASRIVTIPLLTGAVLGLTYYIAYLFLGTRKALWPLVLAYALVTVWFYALVYGARPIGVTHQGWIVEPVYANPLGASYRALLVAVGLGPIVGALAYASLLFRVEDRGQRYRVALVSTSLFAYVGGGLVARLYAGDFLIFITLVGVGLLAAACAFVAYFPPARVRDWLTRPVARRAPRPASAMIERFRELI